MKKHICIGVIAALLLALSLAACAPKQPEPPTLTPAQPAPDNGAPTEQSAEEAKEAELLDFESTHIEAADYELEELLALVRPFNIYPEEFDDPTKLSDTALFFAAVTQLNGSFELTGDGYTYSLAIKELAPAIKGIFGEGAALSEGWEYGSYEPYAVDAANGAVLKYSLGQITSLDFVYACVKTADGWEMWLLDLYDPLFSEANPAIVESGDASSVKWDMVAPYASQMQTGIYTVRTASSGELYLAGFHYRNFKDVAHFSY